MDAASEARQLQQQTFDAEQKKFNLGASTSTLVLRNESGLATAQSNLVSAEAAYVKSRVELDRATGLLLDHAGVMMDEAVRGQVTHKPAVPYVEPRQNPESVMQPVQVAPEAPKPPDQPQQ